MKKGARRRPSTTTELPGQRVNSKRFGDPLPGLLILFVVALL